MTDILPAVNINVPARQSPFADGTHFQTAWDSTSLGLLKECPRKYYYEIILGWRSGGMNVHLTFGLGYHAALEAYDHARCAGADHVQATRAALKVALKAGGHHDGGMWNPWRSTDPYKNIWTLCRSVVWYLDHFKSSPMHTAQLANGKPAVELSFFFDFATVNGISVGLCGHMDRVAIDGDGRIAVHDRKTTKSQLNDQFFAQFSPHNQFTLYTVASHVYFAQPALGIIVDAVQVGVNFSRFQRRFVSRPTQVLNEWMVETEMWIDLAAQYAEREYWPMNDKSCGNYGGCPFRSVCSKSPVHRQSWLEADFKPFRWNPLEVRGDI